MLIRVIILSNPHYCGKHNISKSLHLIHSLWSQYAISEEKRFLFIPFCIRNKKDSPSEFLVFLSSFNWDKHARRGKVNYSFSFFFPHVFWDDFCDNLLENAPSFLGTQCVSQREWLISDIPLIARKSRTSRKTKSQYLKRKLGKYKLWNRPYHNN